MEEVEKTLRSYNWNEESTIYILLNSSCKNLLKDFLPLFRRYTNAIVINYKEDLSNSAMIRIGKDTIAFA
jgi:hypothetical protein